MTGNNISILNKASRFMRSLSRHPAIARQRSAFAPLHLESLEHRLLLAADWQNPLNPYDVDASAGPVEVTATDVLMIINELSAPQIADPETLELPSLDSGESAEPPFVDVNGDGFVSASDAIQVINALNANAGTGVNGGGDPFAPSNVMAGTHAASSHGVLHDTLVNTVTRHSQTYPDVATGPLGISVIVWQSLGQDGSGWGIFGQRYDAGRRTKWVASSR